MLNAFQIGAFQTTAFQLIAVLICDIPQEEQIKVFALYNKTRPLVIETKTIILS